MFLVSALLQTGGLEACAMDAENASVDHAAMNHPSEADCCDTDSEQAMDGCEEAMHCSLFASAVVAIPPRADIVLNNQDRLYNLIHGERYHGPPADLLYRPPIA